MAAEDAKSFVRRDTLRKIEQKIQNLWKEHDVYRAESRQKPPEPGEKFFGNFPFPYMNGFLHLGHAFSLSKLEFSARYHRLRGANVLLPFGFHGTGMPIKASADKIAQEIQQFGHPPVFPSNKEEQGNHQEAEDANSGAPTDNKFKGKKSKTTSKSSGQAYQWEIMRSLGLSDNEITKFCEASEWLNFFPPMLMEDLKAFGLGCDWSRSFITTDRNPYFDKFVGWQMRKLKDMDKVVKAKRYAIYSPLDGQPCADHDRATGEGVQPQEYTIIKMEVVAPFPSKLGVLEGRKVFLAAATLRPETMYGQTNAWVLPNGRYGAFEVNETDVFILTQRAALNLAYQGFSKVPEKTSCLIELTGYDLIGLPLKSPLARHQIIYALPMLTIITDKGTGIVTSVPGDAPDDYMALHDLKSKPAFREKYGVKDGWVMPFEIIPIINIPEFGDKAAEKVCGDLKIKSQNEKEKLAEAKRLTYLKGFTEGTLLVGEFAGRRVQEAKPWIRSKLMEAGSAIMYSEPEKLVVSRSGDECVVAQTEQWYIPYGEEEWKKLAEECLSSMDLYSDVTRHGFEHTLSWLNQWACSRSFGLGTRIPWDEKYLVESLSDSTIYMAYYTIAHLLHNGDMYGDSRTSGVTPEQMTNEVWDFIFCDGPFPKSSDISSSILNKMKQEFEYWYPFDLRVSGKDLIQNHLTFCIYNHTAIMPKKHWPRGFRCNGHLMLNGMKMAKSTGNFMTLRQAIEEYSADATRFALADSGDGVDDANFVFDTANTAILKLTKEIAWMEEILNADSWRTGSPSTFADRVFLNEINIAVKMTEQNYQACMFRDALTTGFYGLQTARDWYKLSCGAEDMNRDLMWHFMDVETRMVAPICPHYAEYVWRELLKKGGFVVNAGWPAADAPDPILQSANKYLKDLIDVMRKKLEKYKSNLDKVDKNGAPITSLVQGKKLIGLIYVKEQFDEWKAECLRILQNNFNIETCTFAPDRVILEALQSSSLGQANGLRQIQNLCMPFVKLKKKDAVQLGAQALDLKLPFGEVQVLEENIDLIKKQLVLEEVQVLSATNPDDRAKVGPHVKQLEQNPPFPGSPTTIFLTR
ncbi:leucine--tRNA ligase, cytoplasmic-like [Prunus avium]|uniref:leucine--tRNA ligase n=1 Tax=Prunus avium TaxID=42229 RepID=A0A6P5S660_PRUAV|nr:leucine--tRNA ligase, cytoplasmic-like [Prunus avium]